MAVFLCVLRHSQVNNSSMKTSSPRGSWITEFLLLWQPWPPCAAVPCSRQSRLWLNTTLSSHGHFPFDSRLYLVPEPYPDMKWCGGGDEVYRKGLKRETWGWRDDSGVKAPDTKPKDPTSVSGPTHWEGKPPLPHVVLWLSMCTIVHEHSHIHVHTLNKYIK